MENKLYRKYSNKRVNAKKENIAFNLTFDEYSILLDSANISIEDLSNTGYHLARYNDTGDYSINNCRFIHYKENIEERKVSERNKKASRHNISKYMESVTPETQQEIIRKIADTKNKNNSWTVPDNRLTDEVIKGRMVVIDKYQKKHGWLTICSKELNISRTQLQRFMKTYYK